MPIHFPQSRWPSELIEEGPDADPAILLSGTAEIGDAMHRVMAVRVRKASLQVDFRADLDEDDAYSDYPLEAMLEELDFFDDFERSTVVTLESGDYVVWVVPTKDENSPQALLLPRGAL